MLKNGLQAFLLCALTVTTAHAEELSDAAQALCENVKTCAMAQLEGQELTPQAREMMQPALDSMCAQVQGRVSDVPTEHALYKPAVACMQSMSTLTCEMMQDPHKLRTPACEAYEKLARESGAEA
jgi:hypothetical protein